MYTPPMFKPDCGASLGFAQACGIGTVCAWNEHADRFVDDPFVLTSAGDDRAACCVSRRAWQSSRKLGGCDGSWLLAVNGADAYVSARYASPDQVPTWLYQAVHLSGSGLGDEGAGIGRSS